MFKEIGLAAESGVASDDGSWRPLALPQTGPVASAAQRRRRAFFNSRKERISNASNSRPNWKGHGNDL
jgi:hypothetical protein